MITLSDISAARLRIGPFTRQTPMMQAKALRSAVDSGAIGADGDAGFVFDADDAGHGRASSCAW